MSVKSLAQFIESSKVLIENARELPEVTAALAGYGYDAARLAEGQKLWAEVDGLARKQAKEYGEQYQASAEVEKAREDFESAYMKSLKVARVAFAEDALASAALKLYGPRRQNVSGWADQAATFYSNLLGDRKLLAKMGRFGYAEAKLRAEAALLEGLRAKQRAQAKETGEAQAATAARDAKVAELDDWVSDLRAICKVAFYGAPEELDKLGIGPRASPRKKAAPVPAAKA